MLARVFGCCPVWCSTTHCGSANEAYRAGVKLSDSEIQRRVITQAKTTEERRLAIRCAPSGAGAVGQRLASRFPQLLRFPVGQAGGRKVGRPRMKSRKDHRQSFRLTRNGFSLKPNGRLFVAKVGGEVLVRWSRELPKRTVERHDYLRPRRSMTTIVCRRGGAEAVAGNRAGGGGRCRDRPVGDDCHHRRATHRGGQPELHGSQAAKLRAFGAGEVPPAER